MKKFLLLSAGAFLISAAMPLKAEDNAYLKQARHIAHESYLAAKTMCLHAVHAHKDEIGEHEALLLAGECSKGAFSHVLFELGHDVTQATEVIVTEKGQELVAGWEKAARDSAKHIHTIRHHEKMSEENTQGEQE